MKMWDVIKHTRIITGQKLIIKNYNEVLAEYSSGIESENAQYQPVMQMTVGGIAFTNNQLILYVK